ncbi:NUDIX domain-containing protein [Candidatus Gottesmanbacteria bacterium]|nr:NUDIX domain-containing protein [Candidatus Gottesmanbacteria bacterium]
MIYRKTAQRELWEELGIRNLELAPVAKYICRAPNETEMSVIYKTVWDGKFELNKEEISQGKFFTQNELKKAVESQRIKLSFMGRKALEKLGWIPLDK